MIKIEVRMKKLILLSFVVYLSACMKIQKKSDMDAKPEPAVQIETVLPESVIFTLDEVMILSQDAVIVADEVHLKSNARIFTNQFSLNIEATSVYIDRGVIIQSFPEPLLIAKINVPGLSGGTIQITGNDIHGNLQVFMNGQTGGPGLGGWAEIPYMNYPSLQQYRAPCKPNGGKDSGESGSFFLNANQSQDFSISTSMKIAPGGSVGNILQGSLIFLRNPEDYKIKSQPTCTDNPEIAKPGSPGQICLKLSENDLARCESF